MTEVKNHSIAAICPTCEGWVHICVLGYDKTEERDVHRTAARIGGTTRFVTQEEISAFIGKQCARDCPRRAKA